MNDAASAARKNNSIEIVTVPARSDNLCYLLFRPSMTSVVVIDPSDTPPVLSAARELGREVKLVLNTHHHWDHVGGNLDLKSEFDADVYCSKHDLSRIPGADRALEDGERFSFQDIELEVLQIPGHTQGQIAFVVHEAKAVFVGDTVFAMGCGRLLEGRPEQMKSSLERLMSLPQDYRLYFGHEYTQKNASFASSVEPDNSSIGKRLEDATAHLARHEIVPAPMISEERQVNPFMRLDSKTIRKGLGLDEASNLEVFTKLRQMRDTF